MTGSSGTDYRKYQKHAWDSLASEYGETNPLRAVISRDDELVNYYFDKTSKRLLAHTVKPRSDWTVLDIGCGVGRLSEWLSPQAKRIVGIDISEEMIGVAKRRADSIGMRNAEFLASDGKTVAVEDSSADLAVCSSVLKYVIDDTDLKRLTGEICQAVKPGGRIAVIEEVDRDGPIVLRGKEDIAGAAILRPPQQYVKVFEEENAILVHHYSLYCKRLLGRCQGIARKVGFDRNRRSYSFVFRRVADVDVLLDTLLRHRLKARGFCLLYFQRLS